MVVSDYYKKKNPPKNRDGCEANLIKIILLLTQLETATTTVRKSSETIKSVFLRHVS